MRRVFSRGTLALVLGLLAGMALAEPVLMPFGKTGTWKVYGVMEGASFLSCKATHGRGGPGLGIDGGGWMLTTPGNPKSTVKGTLEIDGKSFKGEFRPGGRDYLWRLNDTMRRNLRGASAVVISPAGGRPAELDLKGSSAAMDLLKTCLANRGIEPGKGGGLGGAVIGGGAAVAQPGMGGLSGWGCPSPGKLASSKEKTPEKAATARFSNRTFGTVTLYWVNYRGLLEARAQLLPKQSMTVDTFQGQIWLAKDASGNCLGGGALRPRKGERNSYELK